jgi:hypothetical protein
LKPPPSYQPEHPSLPDGAVGSQKRSVRCCLEEISQRTMFLHSLEEFYNDLRAWTDQNLALSSLFGVVDALQRIVEDGSLDHDGGRVRGSTSLSRKVRFSSQAAQGLEVSIDEQELAFSSLERKECPLKGSSARVAMRRTYQPHHRLATGFWYDD